MNSAKTIIIGPQWDAIEGARNQISRFLKDQYVAKDLVHSATMILSELVENSIKYGTFNPGDQVESCVTINDHMITIEVVHPIGPDNLVHLKQLDEMIQWIRGYQDPFEAYINRLKEISKKPISDKDSGLGLVRIAYEGGAILDFFINENKKLNVSAILSF